MVMTTDREVAGRVSMFVAALLAAACGGSSREAPAGLPGPSPSAPPRFTLSGVVYETTADGVRQPLAGVTLLRSLEEPGGYSGGDSGWTTDAEGRYAIKDLVSGSRIAVAAMSGPWYQTCAATAVMTADVTLDIEASRRIPPRTTMRSGPTLSGIVFTSGAGGERRPSPGTEVYYSAQCRGLVVARTYADADGRYALCRLPAGPGCATVTLRPGPTEWDYIEKKTLVIVEGDLALDLDASIK